MAESTARFRRHIGLGLFITGVVLCVAAVGLLVSYTRVFSEKRNTAVMIGTMLPELKSRVEILAANVEAEQAFQNDALAAREEQAAVYVLPENFPETRAVRSIQDIAGTLTKDAEVAVSVESLTFDPKPVDHGSIKTLGGKLNLKGSYQAVARFLQILEFSGEMMLKDVFSSVFRDDFLRQIEAIAPLSLKAAEDFMYLDILQYAASPDKSEQRMLQDIPVQNLADTRAFILENGAAKVRLAFDGIAPGLHDRDVWPLPLMRIDQIQRDGDKWTVGFTLFSR